jgi:hypothetical protein
MTMSRVPVTFRQADLTRALRAARAAGLEVSGYEIDPMTGKILITTRTSDDQKTPATDLDKWMAAHAN